jgi:hypothetical protein
MFSRLILKFFVENTNFSTHFSALKILVIAANTAFAIKAFLLLLDC